jgi:hypothetical protein
MRQSLLRTVLAGWLLAAAGAWAQEPPQPAGTEPRTRADETFDLNIAEKRITEENFQASTALDLATAGERNLRLHVGAVVTARRIELLLRNVTGRVRFVGDLGRVARVIDSHRAAAPAAR